MQKLLTFSPIACVATVIWKNIIWHGRCLSAMVTYCVTKMITTCSTMIWQFFGNMIAASSITTAFFVQGTTEPIKRVLNNYNIKVVLKQHQTIRNFFTKPKDPVPKDQARCAIHFIPCKDCDKLCIGETKRKFNTRLREHEKAVEQEQPKKSALAEHCLQSGHTITWASSTI